MSIYDNFRSTAVSLMDKLAVPATIRRVEVAYDPVTDVREKHEIVVPCRAVLAPRKVTDNKGVRVIETTAKIDTQVEIGDRLLVGSTEHTVQSVEELAPDGGKPMLWTAVLR